MIIIPNTNPPVVGPVYVHAHTTLPFQIYVEGVDFKFDSVSNADEWVIFDLKNTFSTHGVISFKMTDFYKVDSDTLSALERVIYGL